MELKEIKYDKLSLNYLKNRAILYNIFLGIFCGLFVGSISLMANLVIAGIKDAFNVVVMSLFIALTLFYVVYTIVFVRKNYLLTKKVDKGLEFKQVLNNPIKVNLNKKFSLYTILNIVCDTLIGAVLVATIVECALKFELTMLISLAYLILLFTFGLFITINSIIDNSYYKFIIIRDNLNKSEPKKENNEEQTKENNEETKLEKVNQEKEDKVSKENKKSNKTNKKDTK